MACNVIDVGSRRDADATNARSQCVADVVAIQIRRRNHIVLSRSGKYLLQERVRDDVFDYEATARLTIRNLAPWAAVDFLCTIKLARHAVAPVTKAAFR